MNTIGGVNTFPAAMDVYKKAALKPAAKINPTLAALETNGISFENGAVRVTISKEALNLNKVDK